MTSLGFRRDADHIAERMPPRLPRSLPTSTTESSEPSARKLFAPALRRTGVPRGLIPTVLYSAVTLVVPLLFLYMSYDFTTTTMRVATISTAAVGGLVVVLANDCCCWYNMMLAFHTALEVKVVETALVFAYAADTSDTDMALALTGAIVVVVHLLPFYLSDALMLLSLLAYVGVVVNASILVYLDPEYLLVVGASSLALLAVTMIVAGICEIKTSLLSLVRDSIVAKRCITCERFEL